ncbi:Lrp/AsnC family transcriptional regulator [Curvivirga aplysinae]|uniref:Lrp/AsnC family transcriptional regulator n=1 Tax=Curvivirga aplysinae TaxID=2529852 RepID=UPI001C3FC48C|nr:Lrp/AsnC family transcriptional regulator [Curvivirga aplysinae]
MTVNLKDLDNLDRKLLNLLQKDSRLSAEALAMALNSSRSSIQRRLKNLRESGVIAQETVILSQDVMREKISGLLEIRLEKVTQDILDEFRASMLRHDEIQQCYYVTGTADFVALVVAENMTHYEDFTRQIFTENKNIKRYNSNIIADTIKAGLYVPLKEEEEK